MANAINWFEIPATNYDRAVKFYSSVLASDLQPMEMQGIKMAFLNTEPGEVGGSIIKGEG